MLVNGPKGRRAAAWTHVSRSSRRAGQEMLLVTGSARLILSAAGKKRAVRGASLRHPVGDAGNGEPTVRTLFLFYPFAPPNSRA